MLMKSFKQSISNIFAVVKSDAKRLSRSVVAVVCVFGLALVPCLYAWFNIMSNWDPYTVESTKNLKIAVASEDLGTNFLGMDFNVGDIIIERLKANDQIDWQFPESVSTAANTTVVSSFPKTSAKRSSASPTVRLKRRPSSSTITRSSTPSHPVSPTEPRVSLRIR